MARAVEKRDPYTAGHEMRVAHLAVAIAQHLKMGPEQRVGLRLGAMIHDIGKICLPAEILTRPSRLTETEYELVKTHSQEGWDIVRHIEFPWPIAEMILQHHERQNGSGYPQGLKDGQIVFEARILAVADVVEAMASYRPYRRSLGTERALDEIRQGAGKLYDDAVFDACVYLVESESFQFPAVP